MVPIPEESSSARMMAHSSKSTESLYSTSSSKYSASAIYRRKTQPNNRQAGFIPATGEVRQRVLSARRLRMKTIQNQLADAQQHIAELAHENRILRTLHKRQDSALSKYENTNAELPQLLHSHAEEIRVWQTKYRTLQGQNKELAQKIKQKEAHILSLSDQNKYLCQLNKDKNLEDRQRLTDRVQQLESRMQEKDNDLKLMARRLQLESKSYKIQLQGEHKKYRDAMAKLEKTRSQLEVYTKLDELNYLQPSDKPTNPVLDVNHDEKQNPDEKETANEETKDSSRSTKSNQSEQKIEIKPLKPQKKDELSAAIRKGTNSTIGGSYKPHKGQGDGLDSSFEEEDNELDELAKEILLANLESSLDPAKSKKCSFEKQISEDQDYEDEFDDDVDEDNDDDVIFSSGIAKNDYSSIRKKIDDDFKQRQNFLEAYCRQSSAETGKEERNKPISRGGGGVGSVDINRKAKLLAAMKEIDSKGLSDA